MYLQTFTPVITTTAHCDEKKIKMENKLTAIKGGTKLHLVCFLHIIILPMIFQFIAVCMLTAVIFQSNHRISMYYITLEIILSCERQSGGLTF